MSKLLTSLWIALAFALFIYSYGFVDLNLTLSSHPLVFNFVSWAQQLAYFNRSLSLQCFIGLILATTILYIVTLRLRVTHFPWKLTIFLSLIFSLAYPMLSSDVFKYLFAGKMLVLYHANPYTVTPNFFADDTWIRFMRWVHTTMPYGPVFIGLTIPYYLLGMGKFVPILYLFKLDQAGWYLLTIWLIGKILTHENWEKSKIVFAQLFFALNPLILMEWLVNAHNDAIMITLLVLALYLYLHAKRVWSFIALALSAGIKYVTVYFLPLLFLPKMALSKITYYSLAILTLAPLLYHYSWQYQPWYVTWLIPLAALTDNKIIRWTVGVYSFSVFSRYLYFVGTGSWLGTPLQHALMTFLPPVLILVYNGFHAVVSSAQKT